MYNNNDKCPFRNHSGLTIWAWNGIPIIPFAPREVDILVSNEGA
jgi:hypothetical protein